MSSIRDEQKRERSRRQSQLRRKLKAQRKAEVAEEQTQEPMAQHTATDIVQRQAQWQGCCRLAFNLRRRLDEWEQFQTKLQNGYSVLQVDDQRLMSTAVALVLGMAAADVRRWDWLPAPSDDDLAQPAAWVARRLTDRRREQDEAERDRRLRQKLARAFGESQSAGNGTISPVHLQRSKYSLDELAQRLEWTITKHKADGRDFKRPLLDHRNDHYICVRDGGISNKQIIIMANEIVGQHERRPFDDNWNTVMNWWRKFGAKPDDPSAA